MGCVESVNSSGYARPWACQWIFIITLLGLFTLHFLVALVAVRVNEPPIFVSSPSINISETLVPGDAAYVANTTDWDQDNVTYALVSGLTVGEGLNSNNPSRYPGYQAMFAVNETTGIVTPVVPLDFETGPTLVRRLSRFRVAAIPALLFCN